MGGSLSVSNFTILTYQHDLTFISNLRSDFSLLRKLAAVGWKNFFRALTIDDSTDDLMDLAMECTIARESSGRSS